MDLFSILFILHLLGMAMGFSVSFAGLVMMGLIAKASPAEKPVLGRFPPAMMRVGDIGLILLWGTGLLLVYTRWGGFGTLPWQFHVKITAVVLHSGVIGYIHVLMRKARQGDASALARVPIAGRSALLLALVALVFAVLAFG
jgi:hypothetical protein